MREALQEERKEGHDISCNLTLSYNFPAVLIFCNYILFSHVLFHKCCEQCLKDHLKFGAF